MRLIDLKTCAATAAALMVMICCPVFPAHAETTARAPSATGWGPHLGLTVNPDQLHFGLHLHVGSVGTGFNWRPNFDLGFGDGVTHTAVNFELVRRFGVSPDGWAPYAGGGLGASFSDFDSPQYADDASSVGRYFEAGFGFNIIGGFERDLGGESIFVEARLGVLDAPGLKITGGWSVFR